MATDLDFGVVGYFVKDADAHTNSIFIPASVSDVDDTGPDDTVSLVAFEPGGPGIPYGPSPTGVWTADPTPVATVVNPAGYYFVITGNITNAQASANLGIAGAVASSGQAGLHNTPIPLIQQIEGAWSYSEVLGLWHERFGNEVISFYIEAPVETNKYRILVKDVNSAGGIMTVDIQMAVRTFSPTVPTFVTVGTGLSTNGDGTVQEFDITLTPINGLARHKIRIITGPDNGGPLPADQYQVLQIYRII